MSSVRLMNFPRGNASVDPCIIITKPFHIMSQERCYGVTRQDLRASGKHWRAENSKSASGENFWPSSESYFNRRWERWINWIILTCLSGRTLSVNTSFGRINVYRIFVVSDFCPKIVMYRTPYFSMCWRSQVNQTKPSTTQLCLDGHQRLMPNCCLTSHVLNSLV